MIQLYKHQQKVIDDKPYKALIAFETGMGKTLTALQLAGNLKTLVICPKSIKEQWKEQCNHNVITKEEFKKMAKSLSHYECVIVDEAHFFAGQTSQMHKALLWYFNHHHIPNRYLLTATPYMSTAWNIYALGKLLDKTWNYIHFKMTFFNDIRMGSRTIPVQKKGIEKEVANLVSKLGYTARMDEAFDVPEQVFIKEYFELTPVQKKAIASIEDILPIVKWTKTHQICGGTLKSDGYTEDLFFKNEKIGRIVELAKQHKKLIVVCRYNNELDYIMDALIKSNSDYKIMKINGNTENKNTIVKTANTMDECIILVNAACSEGYELPTFPVMVFYSYDFSLKNYIQIIGRIHRANHLKKNVYISLVTKGTVDEDVYNCIQSKKDFDCAIYNKAYGESNKVKGGKPN